MGWFSNTTEVDNRQRGVLPGEEPIEHLPLPEVHTPSRLEYNYETTPLSIDAPSQLDQRLGLIPAQRIAVIGFVSFLTGFSIFSAVGATQSGLRYRAENAHNIPKSAQAWYLYGKSKNYHVLLGGLSEGFKGGARFAGMTAVFLGLEEGLDRARGKIFASKSEREDGRVAEGQKDVLNTVSAAVASSGIYNWWRRHDRWTGMRMTKKGVLIALPFGLTQDLFASLTGEGPWYVRKIRTILGREAETAQVV